MATSGDSDFNPTFDDILQDAAGMVGGGPILAEELISARRGLDYLLTEIQNKNVLLHKIETTSVPTSTSTQQYTFDNTVLDALHVAVQTSTNQTKIPIMRIGFERWADIPVKNQPGRPTMYWFDRQRDESVLNVWPIPNQPYTLVVTVQKNSEQTVRAFQNVDVPRRFLPALVYGIAYYVGLRRMNRVPTERLALLKMEFEKALQGAMREDRERGSYFMRIGRY